jgi:hypothetical protein
MTGVYRKKSKAAVAIKKEEVKVDRKRKLPNWLQENGKEEAKEKTTQTEDVKEIQTADEGSPCSNTRPVDAPPKEEEEKKKATYRKVMFPFPLRHIGILHLVMCNNCILRTRRRCAVEFADGTFAVNVYVCPTCLVKNRALYSLLGQ